MTLVITLRMADLCVHSMCTQAWHHEPWCFRHVRGFYSPPFSNNISQKVITCLIVKVWWKSSLHQYDEFERKHSHTQRYKDSTCVRFLTPFVKEGGPRSQGVVCLWKRLRSHLWQHKAPFSAPPCGKWQENRRRRGRRECGGKGGGGQLVRSANHFGNIHLIDMWNFNSSN